MEARVRGGKAHSEHFLSGVPQKAAVFLDAANGRFVPTAEVAGPIRSLRRQRLAGQRSRQAECHGDLQVDDKIKFGFDLQTPFYLRIYSA
jgi:hypothetical protein